MAAFLILPKICLAEDFENISLEEIKNYLSLPANAVEDLIHSLINLFNSEWINQMASAYSTEEERAVPSILQGAVRAQALNHLLVDAPIEITWGIIKNATKIAKVFLTKDPSIILEELERESVQRAVGYGMSFLLQNEIRITPGAINFKYELQKGGTRETIFQYIMIYKPTNAKSGKLVIRFYSTEYLEPPKNEGSIGSKLGFYTELTHDLPPFIVDIQGMVENYQWVGQPSMKIEFPPEVPDLGIKPLSFWERNFLKPIQTTINDIEVIITKITGISPNIVENLFKIPQIAVDIWHKIKSTFSEINPFSPAAIVQTQEADNKEPPAETEQEILIGEKIENLETEPQDKSEPMLKPFSDLEKMQEELDDIAERIDIISQEVAKLVEEKGIKEEEKDEETEEEILDKDLAKKEKEDDTCFKSVNINTASKEELQKITGVGPVTAQKIIDARPFYSLNDLIKVSGIGEKTLQNIINQGCAYVDSSYTAAGSGSAATSGSDSFPSPQILLDYPERNPVNQQIQVALSLSNFKNTTYDVKVSIESRETTLSEIFNEKENKWQNSYNYLTEVFSGTSFSGGFKLKIKETENDFRGEADIIVKVRENGKTSHSEFIDKINITEPEKADQPQLPQTIVINEVAWMGTKASASDEWIEFYNPGDLEVDIADWSIYGADTGNCLNFSDTDKDSGKKTTIISPGGYLIYANHENDIKDSTGADIVDIWNDAIGMNNTSPGQLILYDALNCQGNIIDIVNQPTGGWFGGKASPNYVSMERISSEEPGTDSENWKDNNQIIINGLDAQQERIFGTPGAENSASKSSPFFLPKVINWDLALTSFYSPYLIQGHTTVSQNVTLTIEPGTVLKFMPKEGNVDSQLHILGTLKAIGSSEEKIIFTSYLDDLNDLESENLKDVEKDTNQDGSVTHPYPGAWKWILFGSSESDFPTSDSELLNVLIRYGDADDVGVIKVEKGSSVIIKDSRLEKNKRGIWLVSSPDTIIDGVEFIDNNFLALDIQNGGSPIVKNSRFEGKEGDQISISVGAGTFPQIENNFFTKNKIPIIMYTGSAPILTGNRGENNQLNGIVISPSGGSYPEGVNQFTWVPNENFPYIIENFFSVAPSIILKIEQGTVIKFKLKDGYFGIQGTLEAEGTKGEPIIFTSLRDDEYGGDTNNDGISTPAQAGDWKNIQIKSIATAQLKWLKIRYAGAEGNNPLTIEEGAKVEKENIIIE